MTTRRGRTWLAWLVVLTAALLHAPAVGADPAREGRARFEQGLRLLDAGDDAEALRHFQASHRVLPSPNTEVLIGHALRRLGRRVEALESYRRVIADAAKRVGAGEARYQRALEEAGRLAAALQGDLAELRVTVRGATADSTVTLAGRPIAGTPDPVTKTLVVESWHEPGRVVVAVRGASGAAQREVLLARGRRSELTLDVVQQTRAPSASVPAGEEAGGDTAVPAAVWIVGATGGAGLVVFGVFEGMALSIASDLEDCRPCPESRRADADRGESFEAAAFVGLGVGVAALTAAAAVWAFSGSRVPAPPRASAGGGGRLAVTSRGSQLTATLTF